MGVQGLTNYLYKNHGDCYKPHELHKTFLVIDGINIAYHLLDSLKTCHELGAKYDSYGDVVNNFFNNLGSCDVNPIVVMDTGILKSCDKSVEELATKLRSKQKRKKLFMLRRVFMQIVRLRGIRMVQIIGDANATMAAVAEHYNCPILSSNSAFFLRGKFLIPWSGFTGEVEPRKAGETSKNSISCVLFRSDIFLKHIRLFDKRPLLPLALLILGHKKNTPYLHFQVLNAFFARLHHHYRSRNALYSHNNIENTLKWLGDCLSLDEAVGELVSCFHKDKRRRILMILEDKMREINTPSVWALRDLGFSQEIIQRAMGHPFVFTGDLDLLEPKILTGVKIMGHEDVRESKESINWNEEKFSELLPKWILDDYLSGTISKSLIVQCTKSRKKLVGQAVEDYGYPPAAMISIPIIKAFYSLLLTLQEHEESDLKFHIVRDECVLVKVERVVKAQIDLRNVKGIRGVVRRRFITDVLGIDGDKMEELPHEWRLYVATVMFWMKQKDHPLIRRLIWSRFCSQCLLGLLTRKLDSSDRSICIIRGLAGMILRH